MTAPVTPFPNGSEPLNELSTIEIKRIIVCFKIFTFFFFNTHIGILKLWQSVLASTSAIVVQGTMHCCEVIRTEFFSAKKRK